MACVLRVTWYRHVVTKTGLFFFKNAGAAVSLARVCKAFHGHIVSVGKKEEEREGEEREVKKKKKKEG